MKTPYLLILLLGPMLCALAASFALGSMLSAPHRVIIGSPPSNLPAQTVTFRSRLGNTLSGWFISGQAGQGGILLMHGVRSNRREMLERAVFLHQAGYSVLLFDFQAHGESEGEQITFGYLEAQDAEAAFAYLQRRIPGQPIGVIGVSLGGASALLSSVSQTAHALVLEAVYPTFAEAVANRIAIRFGPLGRYLTPLVTWQVEPRLGFNPQWLAPIARISQIKAPVLLVAGSEDRHTLLAESKRLFQQAPEPKAFWAIPGASHQNFHQHVREDYEKRILSFFKTHLKNTI